MLNEICTALGDVKTVPFVSHCYGYGGIHIGGNKKVGKGNFRGKVEEHNHFICHDIRLYKNERYVTYFLESRFPTFIDDLKLNIYIRAKNLIFAECKVLLRKRIDFKRIGAERYSHGSKSIDIMEKGFDFETKSCETDSIQNDKENVILSASFPDIQKKLSAYSEHKLEFCILIKAESYFFLHTELQYEYVCVGEKNDREKIWALLGIPKIEKKTVDRKKIQKMELPSLDEAHRLHREIVDRQLTRELEYFLNEPICTVVSENKEVINKNEPELQIRTVDFLNGEINRKTQTINSLRESGATERDKRFLTLLEDPSYMPSKMDLVTLILTLNSLARLDLLTKMMKRFHMPISFDEPFSYQFRKGDLGVLYKRENVTISTQYNITSNTDGTFFYKTDFSVPVVDRGDTIYDLLFTVHFDLEEVYECEIKMEAVSIYESEKYVPFRRVGKNTFVSSICPHLIIPFGKDMIAKTSIKFVAPVKRIKPLVSVHVSCTEVIMEEEIHDEWMSAQNKLRLTKKANNVLELTKLENGAIREQQVIMIEPEDEMDLRF